MRGVRTWAVLGSLACASLSTTEASAWQQGSLAVAAADAASAGALASPALASPALRLGAVIVLLAGASLIAWRLVRARATLVESAAPSGPIDAEWLERHVFSLTPELVGALYDRRIATPEVAAVMARMSVESKLASRVASGEQGFRNLELWLLVEREELTGYERELIEGLFFASKTTSADAIREAYRGVGFDPARILRRYLKESCDGLLGARPVFTWPLGLVLAVSVAGLLAAAYAGGASVAALALASLLGALGPLGANTIAARWRRNPEQPGSELWPFVASAGASALGLGLLIALWPGLTTLGAMSFAVWGLGQVALVARLAASRESPRGLGLRRNLLAARRYFAAELERPEPRIADEWLPYLIALELKTSVDRWFLAYGRLDTAARRERLAQRAEAGPEGAVQAAPDSAWTGGAGAFGGVGASGPWIAATSGLTVAVPGRRRALVPELGYL